MSFSVSSSCKIFAKTITARNLTSLVTSTSRNINSKCISRFHAPHPSKTASLSKLTFTNPTTRNFSETANASSSSKDKVENEETNKHQEEEQEQEQTTQPSKEEQLELQIKDLKDQLLRSLAEQENIRRIAKRDVDNARSFAISSFAKSMLDTSDNLSRAMESVPVQYREDTENHPVLATLYEGIKLTDDNLNKAFTKNGLKKFGEVGEVFDPTKHDALFEYVDANLTPGSVGQVTKVGFMLHDRVIRPAEVGVIKK